MINLYISNLYIANYNLERYDQYECGTKDNNIDYYRN